ncbi:hypothetical protein GZH47_30920 [Paenibacillus rhizovicinus]|uniref:Carbohydrate kinase PfkB domain-containing protein n=1 Tax=Paenibacillus rhizovicinus TaxID=2704463 RepID=A0A6C0P8N7_9BACL|nr:PfkB family carbohydrate kinase [Paenibacillus rhizovicinus]QHW34776.1 hypothetical protein GZH47_30920 [Paenibacillus rhizovicinus]
MNALRPIHGEASYRYARLIGTGGIGSGILFRLAGEQTLGRNESRLGELTEAQDYCKLHIICHYPAVLLQAGAANETGHGFELVPIGKVGADSEGESLIRQLRGSGMSVEHVGQVTGARTLFSVCFQYPDLAGGNITTSNGASSLVQPEDIERAFAGYAFTGQSDRFGANEIVLAAPEVPLPARMALLARGRARGSFTAASVLASEVAAFGEAGGWELTDLLAVNAEEARAIAAPDQERDSAGGGSSGSIVKGITSGSGSKDSDSKDSESRDIAVRCAAFLSRRNPRIKFVMTDGAAGCYSYAEGELIHTPPLRVAAVNTAGAGDAMLGGILSGLCCGLPFAKHADESHFGAEPLESAVELGTLLAALSVTSPHSIHPDASASRLAKFAREHRIALGKAFAYMLSTSET